MCHSLMISYEKPLQIGFLSKLPVRPEVAHPGHFHYIILFYIFCCVSVKLLQYNIYQIVAYYVLAEHQGSMVIS